MALPMEAIASQRQINGRRGSSHRRGGGRLDYKLGQVSDNGELSQLRLLTYSTLLTLRSDTNLRIIARIAGASFIGMLGAPSTPAVAVAPLPLSLSQVSHYPLPHPIFNLVIPHST